EEGSKMNEKLERELENSQNWDYERPEVKEPVKLPRVVVSVAFRRDDFAQVSEYAERLGKKVSEFIREAAIEKVTGQDRGEEAYIWGGGTLWIRQMPPSTRALASQIDAVVPTTTH
ncbi:MAG: hypothetical protein Q8O76_05435, partial [Chloroflexota bacterium]|nr:hypothetical protein [Chloroflexota bacterium]